MEISLVPLPRSLHPREGAPFVLDATVGATGDPDAVAALRRALSPRTGLGIDGTARTIELRVEPGGAPESYRIAADPAAVTVAGADAAGLFYGVQTLAQLLSRGGNGWRIPAVEIEDAPRFRYRGVMLDVARHFHPVVTVRAYIDRAASLKLNALHLHLTDDQGWRLHLDSRPELTARASSTSANGHPGGFYSKADYADIVAYAASRHMIVVPEFDMPGHTHAVGLAHPEIVEDPVISEHVMDTVGAFGGGVPTMGMPYTGWAVGFSSLKIHHDATYAFLEDVFGELAAMTPGPYLHVGGDEAHGTDPADFALFLGRVTQLVARLGKTPIAWHEAGSAPDLDPRTIGQYWGFVTPTDGMDEKTRAFVANGAQVIVSPADAIYLDMKFDADSPLGLTWANGVTSVERSYRWEPTALIDGIGERDILGVEAPLWSETVPSLVEIDALAFPRIASAAEIAWSPQVAPQRTWESFRQRVGGLGPLWTDAGIGFTRSAEIPWI